MSMTISETMKRCYEARELPTWGDILSAADEIDRLSRQLAEVQEMVAWWEKQYVEAQWVIERQRDALKLVREIISEATMTGFNCNDGDWAERLFASQAETFRALHTAALRVGREVE